MARDEAEANREELEAQSERKRRALRRAQEAVPAAGSDLDAIRKELERRNN